MTTSTSTPALVDLAACRARREAAEAARTDKETSYEEWVDLVEASAADNMPLCDEVERLRDILTRVRTRCKQRYFSSTPPVGKFLTDVLGVLEEARLPIPVEAS